MTDDTAAEAAAPTVGVVGLGNMGMPIAVNLVRAGFAVHGADVSSARREELARHGGVPRESAADVAATVDVLVLLLPDSRVVGAVMEDPAMRQALRAGTLVVDMSSSEPLSTRELGVSLGGLGVSLVDAPVSGGVRAAERGSLTIMAGGTQTDIDRVDGLLGVLGSVTRTGALGSGHAMKAINNLLSATHLWATSEAMEVGKVFGLDPAVMLKVLNGSSGRSGSTENKWPNFILSEGYDSGFGLRLMLKDVRTAVGLADQVGVPTRLSAATEHLWAEAADGLPATADHTEVARWIAQTAGAETERAPRDG